MFESRRTTPPVVFLHLPKTAGTTLKAMIAQAYAGQDGLRLAMHDSNEGPLASIPSERWAQFAWAAGHTTWDIRRYFVKAGIEPRIITLLREPVSRVYSLFRYIHRDPDHARHTMWTRSGVTVEQVYRDIQLRSFDNQQVRLLAGETTRVKPFGTIDQADFERARHHLLDGCFSFGLQERMSETIDRFCNALGWPELDLVNLNAAPGPTMPPERDAALIREHNTWDRALYQCAEAALQQ